MNGSEGGSRTPIVPVNSRTHCHYATSENWGVRRDSNPLKPASQAGPSTTSGSHTKGVTGGRSGTDPRQRLLTGGAGKPPPRRASIQLSKTRPPSQRRGGPFNSACTLASRGRNQGLKREKPGTLLRVPGFRFVDLVWIVSYSRGTPGSQPLIAGFAA